MKINLQSQEILILEVLAKIKWKIIILRGGHLQEITINERNKLIIKIFPNYFLLVNKKKNNIYFGYNKIIIILI